MATTADAAANAVTERLNMPVRIRQGRDGLLC